MNVPKNDTCVCKGDIWSGSADKTLKIWRGGNCVKTIKDAEDCVRQLKSVPGTGIVCASNGDRRTTNVAMASLTIALSQMRLCACTRSKAIFCVRFVNVTAPV